MVETNKNSKIQIWSWALYDWGNSSFSTTIMAGFFPVFFKQYWSSGASSVDTTAKLATTVSLSSLIIAILSPSLGVISDNRGSKKWWLGFFMILGVVSSALLGFIPEGAWLSASLVYGLGLLSLNASCVFYDALLSSVAGYKELDTVSSLGYALGYLGGGLLFLINVAWYLKPDWFGFSSSVEVVKLSFISVAIWWFVFSLPLLFFVKETKDEKPFDKYSSLIATTVNTFKELKNTLLELKKNKNLFLLMISFWLYIDGVYTVMSMAVDFGISLNFQAKDLITALLITQFVGFPATFLYGKLAQYFGCRILILSCICVYSLTVLFATHMTSPIHFYWLAVVIGLVQGGIQALSRSLFTKLIPPQKSAEYFGFINLIGKFASVVGPVIVAFTVLLTGRSQYGLLGLLVLFFLGGWLLLKVKETN